MSTLFIIISYSLVGIACFVLGYYIAVSFSITDDPELNGTPYHKIKREAEAGEHDPIEENTHD